MFFSFFFESLCEWNKAVAPLQLLLPIKGSFTYFFCLFIASELAKTPRKSVSFNLKNDPEIMINIPQCSKGKILPPFFEESFHSCFKLQYVTFFFVKVHFCIFFTFLF